MKDFLIAVLELVRRSSWSWNAHTSSHPTQRGDSRKGFRAPGSWITSRVHLSVSPCCVQSYSPLTHCPCFLFCNYDTTIVIATSMGDPRHAPILFICADTPRPCILDRSLTRIQRQEALAEFSCAGVRISPACFGQGWRCGFKSHVCHNVFLFDVCWNPAVDQQAVDRVHGIGYR